uniref:Uncharacterized protein n=1 Tax=Octopus bimaculoides TaxID=37653 RepID=A0A0L8HNX3_OCTBM
MFLHQWHFYIYFDCLLRALAIMFISAKFFYPLHFWYNSSVRLTLRIVVLIFSNLCKILPTMHFCIILASAAFARSLFRHF